MRTPEWFPKGNLRWPIRDWFRARNDRTGNPPLFSGIFPDQMAPIVRNGADGERELVRARWGDARSAAVWRGSDRQYSQCGHIGAGGSPLGDV
jgi:putative SOS response-associated peptidase YedK